MIQILLTENKILFSPFIAENLGLNEAIVFAKLTEMQQYQPTHQSKDGVRWVRLSVSDWQKELSFFSAATVKRSILKLRRACLIVAKNLNSEKTDHTLSYCIHYPGLYSFLKSHQESK